MSLIPSSCCRECKRLLILVEIFKELRGILEAHHARESRRRILDVGKPHSDVFWVALSIHCWRKSLSGSVGLTAAASVCLALPLGLLENLKPILGKGRNNCSGMIMSAGHKSLAKLKIWGSDWPMRGASMIVQKFRRVRPKNGQFWLIGDL